MVLHPNEAFVVRTSAVVEQAESGGPCLLTELAVLQEGGPFRRPQFVLQHLHAVLEVSYGAVFHAHAYLIPLSCGLGVLRLGGNHVVERACLPVVVLAELGIWVTLVVEHLALGARDIDGLVSHAVGIDGLLRKVEDAGVATLGNLPFHLELEVRAELVGEDDVAALTLSLAVEMQASVLNLPFRGQVALAVAAPAGSVLATEDSDITLLVNRQLVAVPELRTLEGLGADYGSSLLRREHRK